MNIQLTWSISKAKDTYGYNRLTALDLTTGKKYVAVGGGYDMTGTVIGELVSDKLQAHLMMLQPHATVSNINGYRNTTASDSFYGLTHDMRDGTAYVDGACGLSAVEKIIKACGYRLKEVAKLNSKGQHVKTLGYELYMA